MTEIKSGDTVRIHYKGTLDDGSVFDSSEGRDPLEFTVGTGQIIPGLDEALPGMTVGEKKSVTIEPDKAYGPAHAEARQAVSRDKIPPEVPMEIGIQLEMKTPDGRSIPVRVVEIGEETVTLDANHPLAGKALTFDFEIVSIN